MNKTLALLLAIALAWLTAWTIAGYSIEKSGRERLAQAEHVREPATRIVPGAEIRVEATIADGPLVPAPFSQKPCIAARTHILLTSQDRNNQGKYVSESNGVAVRYAGPSRIRLSIADQQVELPIERWSPREYADEPVRELPARLNVTDAEIAAAKEKARGDIGNFRITESTLQPGERFFVVAKLEDGNGPLLLEADPVLGQVELFRGTHEQLIDELSTSGGCGRTAGLILGLGVGPLPLGVIVLVLLLRRRRRSAPSTGGRGR